MNAYVAEGTLREWMRAWQRDGFEALKPRRRAGEGAARALPPPLAERLLELKEAEPTCAIRECSALARAEGVVDANTPVAHSTVQRLFVRHGLNRGNHKGAENTGVDRRRFAFREAGQL